MTEQDHFLNEARGLGFASYSLVFALIGLLHKKGILSREEVNEFYEGILQTIENSPYANDPAGRIARGLIDGMAQVTATGGQSKPKADQ
jgi:hypothetical protein